MSSEEIAYRILHELEMDYQFTFDQFLSQKKIAYAVSDTYAETPVRFRFKKRGRLNVQMNRRVLEPYLMDLDEPAHIAYLHVPTMTGQFWLFGKTTSWIYFDVTPDDFARDPEFYLNVLRFVLDLYLLENGKQVPFEAAFNTF